MDKARYTGRRSAMADPTPTPEPQPAILTAQQAADYAEIHISTLYRLLHEGKFPGMKLGGQWRFKQDLIDRWLTEQMLAILDYNKRTAEQSRGTGCVHDPKAARSASGT